jgi:hypothetical protein
VRSAAGRGRCAVARLAPCSGVGRVEGLLFGDFYSCGIGARSGRDRVVTRVCCEPCDGVPFERPRVADGSAGSVGGGATRRLPVCDGLSCGVSILYDARGLLQDSCQQVWLAALHRRRRCGSVGAERRGGVALAVCRYRASTHSTDKSFVQAAGIRTLSILKKWLVNHFYDFDSENELYRSLVDFVSVDVQQHHPAFATQLLPLIEEKRQAAALMGRKKKLVQESTRSSSASINPRMVRRCAGCRCVVVVVSAANVVR